MIDLKKLLFLITKTSLLTLQQHPEIHTFVAIILFPQILEKRGKYMRYQHHLVY